MQRSTTLWGILKERKMADFVTRDVSDLLKPLTNARQSIIRSDRVARSDAYAWTVTRGRCPQGETIAEMGLQTRQINGIKRHSVVMNSYIALKSALRYYFNFKDKPTWGEFWCFTLLVATSIISLGALDKNVDIQWPLYGIVPIRYCNRVFNIIVTVGFYQPERFRI